MSYPRTQHSIPGQGLLVNLNCMIWSWMHQTYAHCASQQNARVKYSILVAFNFQGVYFCFVTNQGQVHKSAKEEIWGIPFSSSNHEWTAKEHWWMGGETVHINNPAAVEDWTRSYTHKTCENLVLSWISYLKASAAQNQNILCADKQTTKICLWLHVETAKSSSPLVGSSLKNHFH